MVEFLARETPDFMHLELVSADTMSSFSSVDPTSSKQGNVAALLLAPVETSKLVVMTHFMTSRLAKSI